MERLRVTQRVSLLLLALLMASCPPAHSTSTPSTPKRYACNDEAREGTLVCRVFMASTLMEDETMVMAHAQHDGKNTEASFFECQTRDGKYHDLVLPQDFIDSHPEFEGRPVSISIPGGCIKHVTEIHGPSRKEITTTVVTYPPTANLTVLPEQRVSPEQRRLDAVPPTRNVTVLVVKVTSTEGTADSPEPQSVYDQMWSNRTGSVVNQMTDCSYGRLNLQMAQGDHIDDFGFYNVEIDFEIDDWTHQTLEGYIHSASGLLDPVGGEDPYDHVIYCLPRGTVTKSGYANWLAYSYGGGKRSVYNDPYCGSLSLTMHEMARALADLRPAAEDGVAYGDHTGYLGGVSSLEQYAPRKCYNARNNWVWGWYSDRQIDLSSSIHEQAWGGRLVPFVDYDKAHFSDAVVIKVGDHYLQYNRQRDFNEGTEELQDRLALVTALSNFHVSQLEPLAGVPFNETSTSWRSENFDSTGYDLVFEVCDRVEGDDLDYMHLSIYLDNGIQSSLCNEPLPGVYSQAPSMIPSATPSMYPTVSAEPTVVASAEPSSAPSLDCRNHPDDPGLIPVNRMWGNQTCEWIGAHKGFRPYLCRPGYEAFEKCQETCNSCNDQDFVPPPTNDTCEDTTRMVFISPRVGNMRCYWLGQYFKRSPHMKSRLCAPSRVHEACPQTCGECTDSCEDSTSALWSVDRVHGVQGCEWLDAHPYWQTVYCAPNAFGASFCQETCNTCP